MQRFVVAIHREQRQPQQMPRHPEGISAGNERVCAAGPSTSDGISPSDGNFPTALAAERKPDVDGDCVIAAQSAVPGLLLSRPTPGDGRAILLIPDVLLPPEPFPERSQRRTCGRTSRIGTSCPGGNTCASTGSTRGTDFRSVDIQREVIEASRQLKSMDMPSCIGALPTITRRHPRQRRQRSQ